ncbi:hypothetical protein ACFRQM_16685 [Streptomyces sp. NPDC056831]|uniref:hypothetical protein n=1 Tax=Streptomyces sp. NPDC056831 TaxID=3345954 RepID=UPI003699855A
MTVHIWDAKHAGGSAEAGCSKAVQNEVDALQEHLKPNGDNRTVKAGFACPEQSGVN